MRLSIEGVSKQYRGGVWGLKDLSLELRPGVLGLLGPNGAGKSTLMRILATVTRPSAGRVLWDGVDVHRRPDPLRAVLGYLPQDFGIYPNLNAVEFLEYLAAVKGVTGKVRSRVDALLELVNLADAKHRPLGSYSGGMRQRIGIAQALLNEPRLLIVDEPTVGLDPEERVRFRNLLADLAGERIVILSTHVVSDVEAAATELAVLDRGQLIAHGPPENLLRQVEGRVWEWVIASQDLVEVKAHWRVSQTQRRPDGLHVRVLAEQAPGPGAIPAVPTLEDAYLHAIASIPAGAIHPPAPTEVAP